MTQLDIDPNQPWSKCRFELFLDQLCELSSSDALRIIGVDGHSGSGKSSLASSLAAIDRDVAVVHTDDLAWHHSFFDWDQLLVDRILSPLRRYGPAVTYQPQPWVDRGRPGAITVPATAKVVIVEGVGACRRELQPWFDATVWVHAQPEVALRRAIAKGADTQQFIGTGWRRRMHS